MPTPSLIGADQVNTELGVAFNTPLAASDARVNRVAANFIESWYTITGSTITVTVPVGATHITAYIWGGGGGAFRSGTTRSTGGGGSFIYARIPLNGATTFTYLIGAGGISPSGSGGVTRLTVNGIQYTAGGGTGGTLTTSGVGGTVTYPGGEGNVLAAQNGFNGQRTIGNITSLVGGDAGGQDYGGGKAVGAPSGPIGVPGAGGSVSFNVAGAGWRGEIRIIYEKPPLRWDQLRWGINFPGRLLSRFNADTTNSPQYNTSPNIEISDNNASFGFGFVVSASASIAFNTNGILSYNAGASTFTRTWLTSGTNSQYTANFALETGTLAAGSSQTNIDLLLSTNRSWSVSATTSTSPPSNVGSTVTGTLIIKDNTGVELLRRRIVLSASASLSN
jgi:hypothetical protein